MLSRHTPPHLGTLILLSAIAVITLNMFLPSLPAMTEALDTSASIMALAVSGYMLMSAVLQLIMGPVSDRLGRRPVLLAALALYTVSSIGCVFAQDVRVFLAFRMMQGVVIAGTILSAAVIRDQFPARDAASKMGTIAASMALAPMLGPMLGGVLETTIGWRMIFALYAVFGALALALVWADLGETRRIAARAVNRRDYAALLRSSPFWAYVLCQAFSVGGFYIFISGIPFVASHSYGLSPALVGVALGSITAGFMLGAAITARLVTRFGLARLIFAGRGIPTLGLASGLVATGLGFMHPLVLFAATLTVGLGNGLTLPNANAGALSVRPDLAGTAAGLTGALSIAIGAGLTWITALVVDRQPTPGALLSLMLGCTLLSLIAALVATRHDQGHA